MPAARGDFDCQEGGHDGRGEAVEGGVDVPSVEPRVCEVVGFGDGGGVEGFVVGVAEGDVLKAFVGRHKAVADDLDLGLVGDCFEVGVEDGAFGVYCFAMTIRGCEGIEAVGELVLGAWGDVGLGFEDYDLVGEEGVTDEGKVRVEEVTDFTGILPFLQRSHFFIMYDAFSCLTSEVLNVNACDGGSEVDLGALGRRERLDNGAGG